MKRALIAVLLLSACGSESKEDPPDAGPSFLECDGSDQAFVRQAHLAILGRRPRSQAEVNVYADIMAQVRALGEGAGDAGPVEGAQDPRAVVVRALIDSDPDGFTDRWGEQVMDALKVPRIEDQSQVSCYGTSERAEDEGITDGALAAYVRDNRPGDGGDPVDKTFTMLDLLRSAIHLDDLSVVYRAHLFALVSRPIPAANVPPVEAELARREDFGLIFDSAYLNRDVVCLGCHNSSGSVTFNPDPALNRHWAMPGLFETAIYGAATGIEPERAHAPFRFDGFVADPFGGGGGTVRPWDWSPSCGRFNSSGLAPDPAEVDGRLASLTGDRLTVFELDAALRSGFETLAADGLVVAEDGTIADPDAAMAYLVAASIVEGVWREVVGTPLTIANYFPRNEAARDILVQLTTSFIRNRFSLRELLVDIALTPYFNRPPAEAGCEAEPYSMPAIYDPWVTTDPDESRRGNGPGDAIVPISGRVLLRATWAALEWRRPAYYAFPEESFAIESCAELYTCREMDSLCQDSGACCEAYLATCATAGEDLTPEEMRVFEQGVGIFLKYAERGFRGLDFQARLVFEDMFGACRNPSDEPDFIATLVARAAADPALTTGDVVAALKDRLVGQASIEHEVGAGTSELAATQIIMGPLAASAADVPDLDTRARELCGVLVSSPQFLLTGMTAPDSTYVPLLTPEDASYGPVCSAVAERGLAGNLALTCGDDSLTVAP